MHTMVLALPVDNRPSLLFDTFKQAANLAAIVKGAQPCAHPYKHIYATFYKRYLQQSHFTPHANSQIQKGNVSHHDA